MRRREQPGAAAGTRHHRPGQPSRALRRPKDYSRARALTLAGVYVLFIAHILHWKLAGRTLAPLELNEVMYTLELGIVTAGFIFMAVAVLATLAFGRFFCSWGCHILALQDLAAWLLRKLRIHPKPIRSRVLLWVPLGAMLYMFAWPQVSRMLDGRAMPALHLRTDAQGWASLLTSDFWRNLPGPGVAIGTFAVAGFLIVYVLGSRGFCTYACPYGAIFRIVDRFSPGRIVARGDCSQCGKCTAVCQSRVLVHRELAAFGRVTDPACLKDLDCVAACPEGSVAYGLSAPAILSIGGTRRIARPIYDFSWGEDILMAAVFVCALFIFRGLYGLVPFLATLALGGILAYLLVLLVRVLRRPRVRFNNFTLVSDNRLTRSGRAFVVISALLIGLTAHSAFVRFHEFQGNRWYDAAASHGAPAESSMPDAATTEAIRHLEVCHRWGLIRPDVGRQRLALLHARLGQSLADRGNIADAAVHFARSTAVFPFDAAAHYNSGLMLALLGRNVDAVQEYRKAIELAPQDPEANNNLGLLLAQMDDLRTAEAYLTRAIALKADYAAPHFNLGRVYRALNRRDDARRCLETAVRLDSSYAPYVADLLKDQPRDGAAPQ